MPIPNYVPMAIPIIPHEFFGAACYGWLIDVVGETTEYRCDECDAVIPVEGTYRGVLETPVKEEPARTGKVAPKSLEVSVSMSGQSPNCSP